MNTTQGTICRKCETPNPKNANFCSHCGTKLEKSVFNARTCATMLPTSYKKLDGLWEVTTEGDVEGRTVKQLGTHSGSIIEIAAKLAKENCYSLQFKAVNEVKSEIPEQGVHISLDIDSQTWDWSAAQRAAVFQVLLDKNNITDVKAEASNYYAGILITKA